MALIFLGVVAVGILFIYLFIYELNSGAFQLEIQW
jgi:hypothetical protein